MSSSSSSRSATPRKPFKTSSNSSQESLKPSIESLASLLIRSLVVLFLLLTSFLLALIAWFSLKSFLKVDPIIGKERVWLQYGYASLLKESAETSFTDFSSLRRLQRVQTTLCFRRIGKREIWCTGRELWFEFGINRTEFSTEPRNWYAQTPLLHSICSKLRVLRSFESR